MRLFTVHFALHDNMVALPFYTEVAGHEDSIGEAIVASIPGAVFCYTLPGAPSC
jgi:hypothetical protein